MAGTVREERRRRVARSLGILAVASSISGTALILLWARPVERVIIVEATTSQGAELIPTTVAPLASPAVTISPTTTAATVAPSSDALGASGAAPDPTDPQEPSRTVPASTGLAELLPPVDRGAAIPEQRARRAVPIGVENTVFDSRAFPIRPIGLEDDGQLEIPDETEIGWYRYGATAGAPGATVLAAHVSWNDTTGPFFELGKMDPGARISVTLDDGTAREYEVVERTRYEKDRLPRDRIWRNTGPESLVLITCGGDFNPDIRRYRHNIVVYAVPVG